MVAHGNNWSDCFSRVCQCDCSIRAILILMFIYYTSVYAHVLAILLEVILVNWIDFKDDSDYYDYNCDDDVFHFEPTPATACSNKGKKNNIGNKK